MNFFAKPIDRISPDDIETLVQERIQESKTLEYKRELPGDSNGDKKEFLADVSSFANTFGGIIIYGIEEEKDVSGKNTGIPKQIVGLGQLNFDQVKQRFEQILRGGIDPKLNRIQFLSLKVNQNDVLLISIPRSLFAPHIVCFQRSGKFFLRTNSGKEQMDVREIKQAFLQTNEWEKQAESFRTDRISTVLENDFQPNLDKSSPCFLHILPLAPSQTFLDFSEYDSELRQLMPPYGCGSWDHRFNLEGFLIFPGGKNYKSYNQYFRNGAAEIYTSCAQFIGRENDTFYGGRFEKFVIQYTDRYLTFLSSTDVEPPVVVFVTCFGLKDKYLAHSDGWIDSPDNSIFDRNDIWLPEAIIEDFNADNTSALRSMLDSFWQAGGWSGSPIQK